ncbi:GtrA family protein [Bacillus sp. sid0103]|uniref:GtrA family protein n=1 Tax=Bacillus sp. sid0103 TaxID=2856337 RepID=UPI001C43B46C|nr:GtrA family protein [Bacillus sp. sid0103]MBV7505771.1 GtrA family protein [Bacillus sp. sid0103]
MKFTFVRFIMVGMVNTMVGLSVMYLLLHGPGLSYWMSTFLGNSVGACVSFFLNRRFTFRSDVSVLNGLLRFVMVILICYFISYTMGENLVQWLLVNNDTITSRVKTDLAVLISTFLYTMLNYLSQKLIVFHKRGTLL